MNIDPNGPRPMEYWAGIEHDAIHAGKPPVMKNGAYNVPTEYHERMAQEEQYRKAKENLTP